MCFKKKKTTLERLTTGQCIRSEYKKQNPAVVSKRWKKTMKNRETWKRNGCRGAAKRASKTDAGSNHRSLPTPTSPHIPQASKGSLKKIQKTSPGLLWRCSLHKVFISQCMCRKFKIVQVCSNYYAMFTAHFKGQHGMCRCLCKCGVFSKGWYKLEQENSWQDSDTVILPFSKMPWEPSQISAPSFFHTVTIGFLFSLNLHPRSQCKKRLFSLKWMYCSSPISLHSHLRSLPK